MPIIEQPPSLQDRSPFKDDRIPSPRRPSSEPPRPIMIIDHHKISPEAEKCTAKTMYPASESSSPKEMKPKYKPPAHPDQPPRKSEYDNIDDDKKKPLIVVDTLRQLLELDENDDREFSKEMVWDYFEQAEDKFNEMDKDFLSRNLPVLSDSGHFLKGSSAAIGLSRVQSTCAKIQHCGARRDEDLDKDLLENEALEIMGRLLKKVRLQYKDAKKWLVDFFDNDRVLPEEDVYLA